MATMKRPFEVEVKRPSDIDTLGAICAQIGANDGDAMRFKARHVPGQIEELLRRKGVEQAVIDEIVSACEAEMNKAAAAFEALIPAGEAIQRVSDTIVFHLRAKRSTPVVRGGYTITGVDAIVV
jgi:hypothetical protein